MDVHALASALTGLPRMSGYGDWRNIVIFMQSGRFVAAADAWKNIERHAPRDLSHRLSNDELEFRTEGISVGFKSQGDDLRMEVILHPEKEPWAIQILRPLTDAGMPLAAMLLSVADQQFALRKIEPPQGFPVYPKSYEGDGWSYE